MAKLRARPQALGNPESNHSDQDQVSESEDYPTGRPKRITKSKAKKAKSAAPTGPKPKSRQEIPDPIPDPEPPEPSRKRAASTAQQSTKLKASKVRPSEDTIDDDNNTASRRCFPPKKRATRSVVDSDHDTEVVADRVQPKPKAPKSRTQSKMHTRGKAAPTPVHVDAEEAGFADEEEEHSDPADDPADEPDEDEAEEEGDDLQGMAADAVERAIADSVPQWSTNSYDRKDTPMVSRPSSRASFSSGHLSVPESNFDEPIDVSSNSDSEFDPSMRGAFSGMKAAHERLPAPRKIVATSRHESHRPAKPSAPKMEPHPRLDLTQVPSSSSARALTAAPLQKPAGKREAKLAQERPEWNDPEPSVSRGSGQHSRSGLLSTKIKREHDDMALGIKAEPEDAALASAASPDNINLLKNSRGTLNLTSQHPDVQNVLGLAIDYFLGFYLLKCAYPNLRVKTGFHQDALTRSARDLNQPLLQARLQVDQDYCSALATVLIGRVSLWRGKVKITANQILHGHYQVQNDCAGLVTRLLDKQAFIYPHKPDKTDPRTGEVTRGKPDNKRPYEHKGVPAVVGCFFKGSPNSIAERTEAMFVRNKAGNLEASQSMVALACAGIFSTLDDYSTGEHKPSDFEGSRVQDVYEVHILILQTLEAKHPEQYHTVMEDIFTIASRGSSFAKGTKAPPTLLQQEALSMLEWSD